MARSGGKKNALEVHLVVARLKMSRREALGPDYPVVGTYALGSKAASEEKKELPNSDLKKVNPRLYMAAAPS